MSQLTIQLDENAEVALEELRKFFNTRSKAAALRNALALASAMVPSAGEDRTFVVRDQKTNSDTKIAIASS